MEKTPEMNSFVVMDMKKGTIPVGSKMRFPANPSFWNFFRCGLLLFHYHKKIYLRGDFHGKFSCLNICFLVIYKITNRYAICTNNL